MTIVDYGRRAKFAEDNFFSNDNISQENKEAVNKFLSGWKVKVGERKGQPVSSARKAIFFNHISLLLERIDNIKEDMHNPEKINKVFDKLYNKLSKSYYSTIVNVSLAMVRRLNEGEKPKGFKDIENLSKKSQKRKLNSKDMVTWQDAKKLMKCTQNLQMKAILATQLDGGLRPSEFTDLNYGDWERKGRYILLDVSGKTGSRSVILYRAVPFLMQWLDNHPTKNKDDPLWLQENGTDGQIKRYDYFAMTKRIRNLFSKAKIEKPSDWYNLRHSACVLAKLDNTPEEEAARKFGHSIEYFTGTYGRLSKEDSLKRFDKVYGITTKEETEAKEISVICPVCERVNQKGSEFCSKCSSPLSLGKALEAEKKQRTELEDMKQKLNKMYSYFDDVGLTKEVLEKAKSLKEARTNENAKTKVK